MRRLITALRAWLRRLLDTEVSQLSRGQAKLALLLKLVIETWRELERDKCFVQASSLAYKSLLSLVPFVVIIMTVSSGSLLQRYQDPILDFVIDSVYPLGKDALAEFHARHPGEKEALRDAQDVREFARKWLKDRMDRFSASTGRAGGIISFVFLVVIIIFLMVDIESTFNSVWGVGSGRGVVSKVASYTAVLFWGPVLMLMTLSISAWAESRTAAVSSRLVDFPVWRGLWDAVAGRMLTGFGLPILFVWAMLVFVYLYMPNTRVRKRAAAAGAVLAAIMLFVGKWAFELYVVNVVAYDKVYGTLSVIPVTLIWLYTSWVIILSGAEVAFTIQNFDDLTHKAERERRGIRLRLYYAVRAVHTVCLRFLRGESPKVLDELASEFQIAEYALRSVLQELVAHRILARVEGDADAFVPARSPASLTVKDVVDALHGPRLATPAKTEADTMWIDADPVRDVIHELFRDYERAADERLGGLSFEDLARRVGGIGDRAEEGKADASKDQAPD